MTLDQAKDVATIISLIAIPVILAVGGWVIQQRLGTRGIEKDYVQLAVDILRSDPREGAESRQLRIWAVKVVDAYAPIKLTAEAQTELIEGGWISSGYFPPGYFPQGYFPPGYFPSGPQPDGSGEAEKKRNEPRK